MSNCERLKTTTTMVPVAGEAKKRRKCADAVAGSKVRKAGKATKPKIIVVDVDGENSDDDFFVKVPVKRTKPQTESAVPLVRTWNLSMAPEYLKMIKTRSVLLLRTAERRREILNEKLTTIMESETSSSTVPKPDPKLFALKNPALAALECPERCLMLKDSLAPHELSTHSFFVRIFEPIIGPDSVSLPGSLLRDWSRIPGRSPSPTPTTK